MPQLRKLSRAFVAALMLAASAPGAPPAAATLEPFLESNCTACHGAASPAASLDLSAFRLDPEDPDSIARWGRVMERVRDGEMPPQGMPQPETASKQAFVESLRANLEDASAQWQDKHGRVHGRRLNRVEYENTLHDLLAIDIPLVQLLPEDSRPGSFDTLASGQQMSHFQLEAYLAAADAALDESFRRALEPRAEYRHEFTLKELTSTGGNNRDPVLRANGEEVLVFSTNLVFVGRMNSTVVDQSGWYRVRFRVKSVNTPPEGHIWTMLRSGVCYARAPMMYWIGKMRVTPEPQDYEFTAWIEEGHMLELRPGDKTLERVTYKEVQAKGGAEAVEAKGVPAVAIQSLSMERVYPAGPAASAARALFGELPIVDGAPVSADPAADLKQRMLAFAEKAFRRPVDEERIAPYLSLANRTLERGEPLREALRAGYRALLSSPRFLYFQENPGELDDYSIASRLSYLLWSTTPDEALLADAAAGRLRQPETLRAQVERLLDSPRSQAFVQNFTGQWLGLREIDTTLPDPTLYPEFDDVLKRSMVEETEGFFAELLAKDLSARNFVDSDFAMLDARLGKHYGLPAADFEAITRFELPKDSPRGGLLGQGAILKITANGTTTSPVLRGAWVNERLLGSPVPPPPADVPAVEPDIRGAKTIREQLAKHRSIPACASCHVKIDPPGFALESFDPVGGWRDHYRALVDKPKGGATWREGPAVDPSYTLPDGTPFSDVNEFREAVMRHPERVAESFAEHLLTYATGASLSYADRATVRELVESTASSDYGVRSIVHAAVESPVFLRR